MDFEIIPYEESFGPVRMPEGFEAELAGKTLEEQAQLYVWMKDTFGVRRGTSPAEFLEHCKGSSDYADFVEPLRETDALIVKDGLVVGIGRLLYKYDEDELRFVHYRKHCMLYNGYCYDSDSDNNGAGYKTRYWYKYLMCLPAGHGLWEA